MLHHLLYIAAPQQLEETKYALSRLHATPLEESNSSISEAYRLEHKLVGKRVFNIHLISDLDAVTPHLRQNPVDLLIYDERGEGGIEASEALHKIRRDTREFAKLWGPDFLFPMSRVVAIMQQDEGLAKHAFELGRVQVRDVLLNPKNTVEVLRWIRAVLKKGVIRDERVGMAISGGGLEGFLFQLGVIHALKSAISGRDIETIDVFSGTSSGSIAAALLAARIPTSEIIKSLHNKSDILDHLTTKTLYDLASKHIGKRVIAGSLGWPGLDPNKWIKNVMKSIPTGFFRGKALKEYIQNTLKAFNVEDSFEAMKSELYIGATDQDSFEHVTLGKNGWKDVSVTDAIRASCALPPFFVPPKLKGRWFIDGQVTKTCNLELVVRRGCRLVMIIDPLKPLATLVPGSVDKQGGVYALIQTVKALVYTRFQNALMHVTEQWPDVDFMVFQPDEECAQVMAGSPMRYKIRTQLIEMAYRSTLHQLRERHHIYAAMLNKYGFKLASAEELKELETEGSHIFEEVA